ncbi:glycosyltransferase involved in cell wall biosynthesis [Lentzea atacamensis]|uniref:Glycosyltransferase involved in cell wall biosynthesis n=1 Tax=Lentzea atacamensis TaxID=531938 RepID=A0A316IBE2_9PSEU|nr:glycosyltransferase [Lentzea atacamensis]PWK84612.1 glycosyltransferase involved in cell wall biosynthesis [Lentzea atacamensis]
MKIAMVFAHASPFDQARGLHVAGLSSALSRHGHDVTVYARRDDPDMPGRVRTGRGYEVVRVPAGPATPLSDEDALPHTGAFISFLLQEWAASPPDVVHGHGWMSGMVSVLGGRRIRVPVVQTFHSLAAVKRRHRVGDTGPEERGRIEVLVGREAAHVAAVSSDEMAELVKAGVDRARISVVPGGVDIDTFAPEGPQARRNELYRVVTTAPLVRYRDIEAVITALSSLDDAELMIAGRPESGRLHDDPEIAKLREHAEHLGVADRVVFVGAMAHSAMPGLLRSADAVVCAPHYEPSGAVALEAMACGVPVVATAVGALADVVVNGVTGLLVPPGEPESLSRALRSLLLDDTLRNEFAVAGRDRVTARYSWSRVAEDVLRVYAWAGATSGKATAAGPAIEVLTE